MTLGGIDNGGTNSWLSSSWNAKDAVLCTAPIACLAGCLTGTVVGNCLRNKRNNKTFESLYGYKESDDEKAKTRKRNEFWSKYNIRKISNDENYNDNIIIDNDKIDIDNNKEENLLLGEDRIRFIEDPDVYGTGITGWFNFLCGKPQYVIEKMMEEQPKPSVENINDNNTIAGNQPKKKEDNPDKGKVIIRTCNYDGWNDEYDKQWRSNYRLNKDIIIEWIGGLEEEDKGDVILNIINQGQDNWDLIFAKIADNVNLIQRLFIYLRDKWKPNKDGVPDAVFNFFIGILNKLSDKQWLALFANDDNYVLNMLLQILQESEDDIYVPALKRKLFSFFINNYEVLSKGSKKAVKKDNNNLIINNEDNNDEIDNDKIELFFKLMGECAPMLTENNLNTDNFKKIQLLFVKIEEQYNYIKDPNNKAIIVDFAINILNKIDKNKDENAYNDMLNFIIQKLNNDKDILNVVFNDNGLKIKVFKFVIDNYDIKDILQTYKNNNNNKLQQNLQTFVIEFFKQYDINIDENVNDDTLMLQLLKTLLERFNNGDLPDDNGSIIELIFDIAGQRKDDDKIYKLLSENWNLIFDKIATNIKLMENLFFYLQNNWLNNANKIPDAVFNFSIDILDKYNGDEEKLKMMFEKIVNENNIEVFIKIILSKDELKKKIFSNDKLKKLFLQHFITQQPDVIIQQLLHVDDYEEEINEDSKNNANNKNNNKNKKPKGQEFLNFFLRLLDNGIEKQVLNKENIGAFLKKILTYVKKIKGQGQLDILWTVVEKMLGPEDMQNMPDSFWYLVSSVIDQVYAKGNTIPDTLLTKINDYTKNYRTRYPEKNVNNIKKNKNNDDNSKKYTINIPTKYQISINNNNNKKDTIKLSNNNKIPMAYPLFKEQPVKIGIKYPEIKDYQKQQMNHKNKSEYGEKISDQGEMNMKRGAYGGKAQEYSVTNNINNKNNMLSSTREKEEMKNNKKRSSSYKSHIDRRKESITKNTNIEQKIEEKRETDDISVIKPKIIRQTKDTNEKSNTINNNKNKNVGINNDYKMTQKDINNWGLENAQWSKEKCTENRKKGYGSGKLFG